MTRPSKKVLRLVIASMWWATLVHFALALIALGLAVEFRSGYPLIAVGGLFLGMTFAANVEAAQLQESRAKMQEESREVAKLKFEAVLRANRVADGSPVDVLAATMEAVSHGVSRDELQEIADRVQTPGDGDG